MRILIVHVSTIALTLEAARSVHATTVSAHGRHKRAFVDFFRVIGYGIHYLTGYHAAKNFVFTFKNNHIRDLLLYKKLRFGTYESFPRDMVRKDFPKQPPWSNSTTFSFADASWD